MKDQKKLPAYWVAIAVAIAAAVSAGSVSSCTQSSAAPAAQQEQAP